MFIKSEWTAPNGAVFEMQHRYEDRALILDVIRAHRPDVAIELGTAAGGFAALLAETLGEWGGRAMTADRTVTIGVAERLLAAYPDQQVALAGVDLLQGDPLVTLASLYAHAVTLEEAPPRRPRLLLYCDNGNKVEEITRYAPLLKPADLLGCHDYSTEVPVEWVESFLAGLGFTPHRHAEFAALADPVNYPASLTRFWLR
jgi:hypothetical protein